jgi:hypothetical protein
VDQDTGKKKKKYKPAKDTASVSAVDDVDVDRPRLSKHPEAAVDKFEATMLKGDELEVLQAVAVSDARTLDARAFDYGWPTVDAKQQALEYLESVAKKELGAVDELPAASPLQRRTSTIRKGGTVKAPAESVAPVDPARFVMDEFRSFAVTEGGEPVMVLSAHSESGDKKDGKQAFLTILAQQQQDGSIKVLHTQKASSDRLYESAEMRLIDAVDAAGDRRAELLFEMRGGTRYFSLWKVRGGSATEVFRGGELP